MTIEEQIAKACADRISKTACAAMLGVSRHSFALMLEHMPPLPWPKPCESKAFTEANKARAGKPLSKPMQDTLDKLLATMRERHTVTLPDGRKGTLRELCLSAGKVSLETARRRRVSGMSIAESIDTKPWGMGKPSKPTEASA